MRLGGNFPNAQQYIRVVSVKFSQQRTATNYKTAKVNDKISPTSICCNSHSTFLSHRGKTAAGFTHCKYKKSDFRGG